jgi:hypothetical protein
MTNEEYIPSIEKLFNTLGSKMAKRYYGLDINFKVESITDDDYKGLSNEWDKRKWIIVKVTPPLPQVFDVKTETDFIYGKYGDSDDLRDNLDALLLYVSLKGSMVNFTEDSYENVSHNPSSSTEVTDTSKPHIFYGNQQIFIPDEKFITLSNGSVVDKKTGILYIIHIGDSHMDFQSYDNDRISRIEDEEWWDSLTDKDKQNLNKEYSS